MTEERPRIGRCPGCKKMILMNLLDEHVTSKHEKGIYEPPPNSQGRIPGMTAGMKLRWLREIIIIAQEYPRGFTMWTLIFFLLLVVLIYGRI